MTYPLKQRQRLVWRSSNVLFLGRGWIKAFVSNELWKKERQCALQKVRNGRERYNLRSYHELLLSSCGYACYHLFQSLCSASSRQRILMLRKGAPLTYRKLQPFLLLSRSRCHRKFFIAVVNTCSLVSKSQNQGQREPVGPMYRLLAKQNLSVNSENNEVDSLHKQAKVSMNTWILCFLF